MEPPNLRPVVRMFTEPSVPTPVMIHVSPLRTQVFPLHSLWLRRMMIMSPTRR